MRMRPTRETLISMLCCTAAGLALAGGMQIAASPIPGSAGARLAATRAQDVRAEEVIDIPRVQPEAPAALMAEL